MLAGTDLPFWPLSRLSLGSRNLLREIEIRLSWIIFCLEQIGILLNLDDNNLEEECEGDAIFL